MAVLDAPEFAVHLRPPDLSVDIQVFVCWGHSNEPTMCKMFPNIALRSKEGARVPIPVEPRSET